MPRKKKPSSSESDDDGLVTSERLQNRDLFDPQISGDEDEELAEDEWEVERILDKRFDTTRRCYEYRVKWKGYEDKHNSWEPEDNLVFLSPFFHG
jgi:hypothetical protein